MNLGPYVCRASALPWDFIPNLLVLRDKMGHPMRRSQAGCPFLSQPSQEVVKEMLQFSKDTLEKIDKARSEGLYHEVRAFAVEESEGEEDGEGGRYVKGKGKPLSRLHSWKAISLHTFPS